MWKQVIPLTGFFTERAEDGSGQKRKWKPPLTGQILQLEWAHGQLVRKPEWRDSQYQSKQEAYMPSSLSKPDTERSGGLTP